MKLEEAIKQRGFESEHEKLAINLMYTAGWIGTHINAFLKEFGLTSQQYNVMRILKGQYPNPSTVLLIKERMLDKESNASRLVDKLFNAGLVNRKQCPNDRRQVDIILTEKGLKLLKSIDPKVKSKIKETLKVSKIAAGRLNDMLDDLR